MTSREQLRARAHPLVQALRAYPTLAALQASQDGKALLEEAHALLATIRRHDAPGSSSEWSTPRPGRSLKLVHWNIEHGNRFEALRGALLDHPRLAHADLLSLNEVDLGMARSGNRDVAFELAQALGLHAVWAPMLLELGVGRHDDLQFARDVPNQESLFGVAILSRIPLGDARLIHLPSPEAFHFRWERMVGRHCALAVEVLAPEGPFVAVTAHLDVHRLPVNRCEQMETLTRALDGERRPTVMAGDFNTTTFRRGSPWDSLHGLSVLTCTPSEALRRRLLRPDLPTHSPCEPLFGALEQAGFLWERYNDFAPTLRLRFERLGEVEAMPRPLRSMVLRALGSVEKRAQLRLDWIAARGFRGGIGQTVPGLDHGPDQASDHSPLVAELEL